MRTNEEILKVIGEKVRAAREAKKTRNGKPWSQTHLAAAIDTSASQISLIETGQREPGIIMLYKIADALGVQPADLLL